MKPCISCKEIKPLEEFHKHPQMADGHLGKCKVCCRRDISANIKRRQLEPEWMARERERCRIKAAKRRAEGRQRITPNMRTSSERWRKRNLQKARAHLKAHRAFPRTIATICERCGKVPKILHRHHPDYSKPLEIIWLCPPCHGLAHRK